MAGKFAALKLLQHGHHASYLGRLFLHFKRAFQVHGVAGLHLEERLRFTPQRMEGLFVALAPGRGQLLKLLVALYLVKALLKNGALLIKIVATAVIAYAEVVASHIVLLHAIDLMDTSGCIAGRIANR